MKTNKPEGRTGASPVAAAPAKAAFLVRMIGGYAIRFFSRGFELVSDKEATIFHYREEALNRARFEKGLRIGQFNVEEISNPAAPGGQSTKQKDKP